MDEAAERSLSISMARRTIENIATRLSTDVLELTRFAYILRKLDIKDEYSEEFLNGNVMPSILVDIILSNKWNPKTNSMQSLKEYVLMQGDLYLSIPEK